MCRISLTPQHVREGWVLSGKTERYLRKDGARVELNVDWIPPREQGPSAGSAGWLGVMLLENYPGLCKIVEVRHQHLGIVPRHIIVAEIIR